MTARTPEDIDRLFAERMAAGDVDGVVALYEPGGGLVSFDGIVTPPAAPSRWRAGRSSSRGGSRTGRGCSCSTTRSGAGRASLQPAAQEPGPRGSPHVPQPPIGAGAGADSSRRPPTETTDMSRVSS